MFGRTVVAATVLAMMALAGCRTVSGMRAAPLTEGVRRSYYANYDDVTQAAYDVVRSIGLGVEEAGDVDPNTWHLIATAGVSAFSWGELVRVSVQRQQAMPVNVWVLTRRRLATNITAKGDYSPDVFQRMDFALRPRWTPPPPAAPDAAAPKVIPSGAQPSPAP
jgi:hypothetical protein